MSDTALKDPSGALIVNQRNMPFELDGGLYERAAIGVVVLASDQTIEHEFRKIIDLPGVAFYESRIFNANIVTPESLKAMEGGLKDATALILPGLPLDVVAFGCTSGAMMIGEDKVAQLIHEVHPGAPVTSPMQASLAAFKALGMTRIAMLTPYIEEINQAMRAYIEADGVSVPVVGSFNEENDNKVGRISPESVRRAALELGRSDLVEGVFVSCSALRVLEITPGLEAELGKPVVSSNSAMAWHCLRLAGIDDSLPRFGRLFAQPLA